MKPRSYAEADALDWRREGGDTRGSYIMTAEASSQRPRP